MSTDASGSWFMAAMQSPCMMVSKGRTRRVELAFGAALCFPMDLVIPRCSAPHTGKTLSFDMGDARGHWEGETLVVETTNFKGRSVYRNANPATLRLVERFTRTAADAVEWAVTVDDSSTWTRPWTFSIPLTMNDREPVLEYACHEGNHAVRNILSAARSAEKHR